MTTSPSMPNVIDIDSLVKTLHNSDYDSTVASLTAKKKQRAESSHASRTPTKQLKLHNATPTTAPVATTEGALRDVFTVQIEASIDYNLIQKHHAVLKKKGVNARVETFHNKGTEWYRLRVGAFKTKDEARTELAQLRWTEKSFATRGPAMFFNDGIVR